MKRLLKELEINPRILVLREDKDRWIRALYSLLEWDEKDLREEYLNIVNMVGPDKPKIYYLEALRRNLMIRKSNSYKTQGMAKNVKEIFKEMFK